MEAFLVCTGTIAIAEIGDKTQLLAIVLAARFKRPWPIVLGIFAAILTNHTLAGLLGAWLRHALTPGFLRWCLGISFFAAAAWALKPDKVQDERLPIGRYGVFIVTFIAFFVAEIGDKTQLITAMLAAKFSSLVAVVAGTTTGMMLANIPAVFLGSGVADRIPLKAVRLAAAVVFFVLGIATLAGALAP
jgi:putative Ca2+/H+ antiporter (TMEM165/GDT1 family)